VHHIVNEQAMNDMVWFLGLRKIVFSLLTARSLKMFPSTRIIYFPIFLSFQLGFCAVLLGVLQLCSLILFAFVQYLLAIHLQIHILLLVFKV
jgi:hypothetical protein